MMVLPLFSPGRSCFRSLYSRTRSICSKIVESKLQVDPFAVLIPITEHQERQQRLAALVSESLKSLADHKAMLVIPAARKTFQADTQIPLLHFKQCSDFIYLTGLNTAEAANCVLVILTDGADEFRSLLFVPFHTEKEILWEGPGLRTQDFCERMRSISVSIENVKYFESFVHEECERRTLYTTRDGLTIEDVKGRRRLRPDSSLENTENMIRKPVLNLSGFMDQLRLIKSANEFNAMVRTCAIGSAAMNQTRAFAKKLSKVNSEKHQIPLVNEGQISARFDYEVRVNGAAKLAYPSVVAGGPRSTIIHYGSPDKFMTDDDWLLMDAGCEDKEGYNSDITRCWIVGGTASSSQSRLCEGLYEALCEVQKHLIQHVRERDSLSQDVSESVSLDHLFQVMCALLGKVLIEFCLIPKSSSSAESARAGYKFCPHHVSHYLGLDVHDTPSVSRNIPLKPGMCFTVEPGLYFRDVDDVKKEFKGIGVRVEDDLIISQSGEVRVLTEDTSWT